MKKASVLTALSLLLVGSSAFGQDLPPPAKLTARASWKSKNRRAGEGTALVMTRDEAGRLRDGANVRLLDGAIEEVKYTGKGVQLVRFRFPADRVDLQFSVTLGDLASNEAHLVVAEEKPIEKEKGGAECAVAPGFGFVGSGFGQRGVRIAASCGYRFPIDEASIAVAGEIGLEGYPAVDVVSDRGDLYEISQVNTIFALPISYRFLPHERPFVPYLTLVPQLLLQSAERTDVVGEGEAGPSFPSREKSTALPGLAVKVGGQVRLGPGGFFLELGYRGVSRNSRSPAVANATGLVMDLGYRFQF